MAQNETLILIASRMKANTPDQLIGIVCNHFDVPKENLMTANRGSDQVNLVRQVCIVLLVLKFGLSMQAASEFFNRSNHHSGSRAFKKIHKMLRKDNEFRIQFMGLSS